MEVEVVVPQRFFATDGEKPLQEHVGMADVRVAQQHFRVTRPE